MLLKPSAGGGGKGMHVVLTAAEDFAEAARARREAAGAFGDDRLILERYLARPRHVEVQLLGDEHGKVVHLGERECSFNVGIRRSSRRRHRQPLTPPPARPRRCRDRPGVGRGLHERRDGRVPARDDGRSSSSS